MASAPRTLGSLAGRWSAALKTFTRYQTAAQQAGTSLEDLRPGLCAHLVSQLVSGHVPLASTSPRPASRGCWDPVPTAGRGARALCGSPRCGNAGFSSSRLLLSSSGLLSITPHQDSHPELRSGRFSFRPFCRSCPRGGFQAQGRKIKSVTQLLLPLFSTPFSHWSVLGFTLRHDPLLFAAPAKTLSWPTIKKSPRSPCYDLE